ncbi:hypothetical protein NXS97_00550 [Pantoea sp. B623]|uniref:hypothetical protein n=1 Tax=Pantoea sp. B623 TaxID=2974561 RepID=UPI00216A90B6|nr:hypothetical protein [Pantoea sp. B623]MCS4492702.1 hypothetical protein [Pantoea sp. B623]
MFIHHYTRAATLPLILASGKIRFTRADLLDDASEMPFETAHLTPQHYFISSWTHADKEQSGQWYRYGDLDRGIRISLPSSPFSFNLLDGTFPEGRSHGIRLTNIEAPFSLATMLGNGYVLMPYSAEMRSDFAGDVEYVKDPSACAEALYRTSGKETLLKKPGRLGRIKSEFWCDQHEFRFVLMACKGPKLSGEVSPEEYGNAFSDLYEACDAQCQSNPVSEVEFIDLPLRENIFSELVITLGPCISDDEREKVVKAMGLYAPAGRIEESAMNIRNKGPAAFKS